LPTPRGKRKVKKGGFNHGKLTIGVGAAAAGVAVGGARGATDIDVARREGAVLLDVAGRDHGVDQFAVALGERSSVDDG
jgi:hypothetical protein